MFFKNRKSTLKYSKYETQHNKLPLALSVYKISRHVWAAYGHNICFTNNTRFNGKDRTITTILLLYIIIIYYDLKIFASHKPYNINQNWRSEPIIRFGFCNLGTFWRTTFSELALYQNKINLINRSEKYDELKSKCKYHLSYKKGDLIFVRCQSEGVFVRCYFNLKHQSHL